jgi:hypothetical protein
MAAFKVITEGIELLGAGLKATASAAINLAEFGSSLSLLFFLPSSIRRHML